MSQLHFRGGSRIRCWVTRFCCYHQDSLTGYYEPLLDYQGSLLGYHGLLLSYHGLLLYMQVCYKQFTAALKESFVHDNESTVKTGLSCKEEIATVLIAWE